jgi:hypothetical protein
MSVAHACCVLYRYRSLQRADPSIRGALPCVYGSLSVISRNSNSLHLKLGNIRGQNETKQMKEKPSGVYYSRHNYSLYQI